MGGNLAASAAGLIPLVVVWAVGAALCFLEWRRCPKAAGWALAGLGLLAANTVAWRVFYAVVFPRLASGGGIFGYGRFGFAFLSFLGAAVEAAGIGLLVYAVFQDRNAARAGGADTLPGNAPAGPTG